MDLPAERATNTYVTTKHGTMVELSDPFVSYSETDTLPSTRRYLGRRKDVQSALLPFGTLFVCVAYVSNVPSHRGEDLFREYRFDRNSHGPRRPGAARTRSLGQLRSRKWPITCYLDDSDEREMANQANLAASNKARLGGWVTITSQGGVLYTTNHPSIHRQSL